MRHNEQSSKSKAADGVIHHPCSTHLASIHQAASRDHGRSSNGHTILILPLLVAVFGISRLQLTTVRLQAHRHRHTAAFHQRLSTSLHGERTPTSSCPNNTSSPLSSRKEQDDSSFGRRRKNGDSRVGEETWKKEPAKEDSGASDGKDIHNDDSTKTWGGPRRKDRRAPENRLSLCVQEVKVSFGSGRWRDMGGCGVPVLDLYIGTSLLLYGEWAEEEVRLFARFVHPGDTVIDAGAHIGSLSLPLARLVGPNGRVVSFEPTAEVYKALALNIAVNGLSGYVTPVLAALGSTHGHLAVPHLSMHRILNSGQTALRHTTTTTTTTKTTASHPQGGGGMASARREVMSLDMFELPSLAFIKIDVQGMELEVVQGAAATLSRCLPVVYLEAESNEVLASIRQRLRLADSRYRCYSHVPQLYNAKNYFRRDKNVFGEHIVSKNILCLVDGLHPEVQPEMHLQPL
eukprot:CAMPEP_0179433806 /NCGR_PEP_ID=MMETSP0799-20121207/18148_1 /TAXON_ID=46947 /ORGANISM="Geminigera cryophila, Strain CCMP2564" /LENGTH=459 /DNA_ID=CAMNT_0021212009 /DNA_START=296 /DNA_END=1674 /DNA_ORIENTATION=+